MRKNQDDNSFPNIASVSWTDQLLFGQGDGRLSSQEALERRMRIWRQELGAGKIYWRHMRNRVQGKFHKAWNRRHFLIPRHCSVQWDDFSVVPQITHSMGMKAYLYTWLFDEGWPLLPSRVRKISYHNAMHQKDISWQSLFSYEHPEYARVDRTGKKRQWGVLSLSYPEVRSYFQNRYLGLLDRTDFDGLFISLRSQSCPADFADQYEFNEPVRKDFLNRHGRDIIKEDFDLNQWRDLLGEYLTIFIEELKGKLVERGIQLAIGIPVGDILGPPMGNTTLNWREWVTRGLIDELVINQNSSQCPSMWLQLWSMHRGYGYLKNYLDGYNLPPLPEHIESIYAPIFQKASVKLYIARQWDKPSPSEEASLAALPGVEGLVFSSFRFDNPGPISRGDWRAKRI